MAESIEARTKQQIERWRILKSQRSQWLTHWDDLARIELPRRLGFVTQTMEGERRTEEIYDGTAMRAARSLANAVGQLLRPEGDKWFLMRAELESLNREDEVLNWLRLVEEKLLAALLNPRARFRQATGEADMDLVVFGTAVVFSSLSLTSKRLQFNSIDLKDAVIGLNENGNPDTVFQERKFTLRQAEKRFGKDNLSTGLKERLEGGRSEANLEEKVNFLRVVQPRPTGRADAKLSRNFLFTDDWIEIDNSHEVQKGGFREFPFVVPRWDTSSGETYGRSPGMIALPDAETANAMSETILVSGQKAADSPVFAPNDSSFDAVNSFSGGITYYDVDTAVQLGGNPFFTMRQDFNLPITRDMQSDVRQQIEAAFFKNIFNLPVRGPEMTATEVITRKEEFIREIGSVFGRLESDYLAPLVERSFSLMLRVGLFDPIPEILRGKDVRFEFTSPIKKIREQAEASAARLWVQELLELTQVDEESTDWVNTDELARFSARALDLPPILVMSTDAVEAKRAERAAAAAEQAEREKVAQEMQIAASGGQAAKSVSDALGGVASGAGELFGAGAENG